MILAFTGAGISAASGISTFQQQPGIRDKLTRSFANEHPAEYRELMREWVLGMRGKEPNDAHYALAEYRIPVITMNVDGLHQIAAQRLGQNLDMILPIHGRLPTEEELDYCDLLAEAPVLYGDMAPNYVKAFKLMEKLEFGDTFLIIGASDYTNISTQLRLEAIAQKAQVVDIQEDAEHTVRKFLEGHYDNRTL